MEWPVKDGDREEAWESGRSEGSGKNVHLMMVGTGLET